MAMIKIKVGPDAEAEDIPGMRSMDIQGYANRIDGLFYLDHHDNLRAVHGDYPIATTAAQLRRLIDHLEAVEARMTRSEG